MLGRGRERVRLHRRGDYDREFHGARLRPMPEQVPSILTTPRSAQLPTQAAEGEDTEVQFSVAMLF